MTLQRLLAAVVLGLVLLYANGGLPSFNHSSPNSPPQNNRVTNAKLEKVIDGDTLRLRIAQRSQLVRLIGIDAPERVDNEKARRDAERSGMSLSKLLGAGERARLHMVSLISHHSHLRIEYDQDREDKFGRVLAYVFTESGIFLNEAMIRDGFAVPLFVAPNTFHRVLLEEAAREARNSGRALWQAQVFRSGRMANSPLIR